MRKKASQIRLLFWATCCFFIIKSVILMLLFNSLKYTPIHIYIHKRGIILWFLHIRAVATPLIFLITFPIFAVLNGYQIPPHPPILKVVLVKSERAYSYLENTLVRTLRTTLKSHAVLQLYEILKLRLSLYFIVVIYTLGWYILFKTVCLALPAAPQ